VNNPKVSFIVPFYNVELYLAECIESIANQSLRDIEIILVDDCGSDGSRQIAQDYAKKDNRIQIVTHQVNKGQGAGRNTGLAIAKGEYIWFVDSDDMLSRNTACEELYNLSVCHNKVDAIRFNSVQVSVANNVIKQLGMAYAYIGEGYYTDAAVANWVGSNLPIHAAVLTLFKRDFLVKNTILSPECRHEDSLVGSWLLLATSLFVTNASFYYYRIRANSTTTSLVIPLDEYKHLIILTNESKLFYRNHLLAESYKDYLVMECILKVLFCGKISACYQSFKGERKKIAVAYSPYLVWIAANMNQNVYALIDRIVPDYANYLKLFFLKNSSKSTTEREVIIFLNKLYGVQGMSVLKFIKIFIPYGLLWFYRKMRRKD
jgi:glycosyltransferase involved in cell wall biosynthesis